MNKQINLRLPQQLLVTAQKYSRKNGYGNLQEFITETIREKLYPEITREELMLVKRLIEVSDKHNLYGTEEELFRKLRDVQTKTN
ncbi:hypothetical protein JXA85_01735 [Candidatus Woesearchaeota archaeon]|nr:hypothetical protein [Candidatus Woesearchaeota archaeon]